MFWPWKRVILIWEVLYYIEMFYHTWYITDIQQTANLLEKLQKYNDEHTKMITWQLIRYANSILGKVIKDKKGDYEKVKSFKFSKEYNL